MEKRVLLVEDDASLARSIVEGLSDEGFAVTHAADGDAALEALRSDTPTLFLSWRRSRVGLLSRISFVCASPPEKVGPTLQRSEGRSLPERLSRELHAVEVLWNSSRTPRLWHPAKLGVYSPLIEQTLRVRPTYCVIVCGDGTGTGSRMAKR